MAHFGDDDSVGCEYLVHDFFKMLNSDINRNVILSSEVEVSEFDTGPFETWLQEKFLFIPNLIEFEF